MSDSPRYLVILMDAGNELGSAADAYIESLEEAGFLPTSGFGVVDLISMPDPDAQKHGARLNRAPEITVEFA